MKDVTIQDVLFVKKKTIPKIWNFLKKHNLCFIFTTEIYNYYNLRNIDLSSIRYELDFVNSFNWNDSIKGFGFWKEQADKFINNE